VVPTRIAKGAGALWRRRLTYSASRTAVGFFLWEAFVSGLMKAAGTTHHDDARLACQAFVARWPDLRSDVPGEPALNHAVSSAMAAGLSIRQDELVLPALVVGVTASTAVEPATT